MPDENKNSSTSILNGGGVAILEAGNLSESALTRENSLPDAPEGHDITGRQETTSLAHVVQETDSTAATTIKFESDGRTREVKRRTALGLGMTAIGVAVTSTGQLLHDTFPAVGTALMGAGGAASAAGVNLATRG